MNNIVENALDILRKEEGFEEYPYEDLGGGLTIGYGCNLAQEPLYKEEGEWMLIYRVGRRVDGLVDGIEFWSELPPDVRTVLIAMAYQMGVRGTLLFKRTLEFMREGMWANAAEEMLDSNWARNPNTAARAKRMAAIVARQED
jgi:GH24 family phage-related lysozyme (muramidase)